ncbi:ANTAR domain-containing protein [Nocardioides dilutus]
MPVHRLLLPTNDSRHPDTRLFDALLQWRDSAWTATSECHVPERRAIDANRATIERAKGALMQRYGMDSFQAFSLMVRWARQTRTPLHTLAKTLVQGIDDADPQAERRHRTLTRWLEVQLRHTNPEPGDAERRRTPPDR